MHLKQAEPRVGAHPRGRNTQGAGLGRLLPVGSQGPQHRALTQGIPLGSVPPIVPGSSTWPDTQQDVPPYKVGADSQKKGDSNHDDNFESQLHKGQAPPMTFLKWRLAGRVYREHKFIQQTWGWHSGLSQRDLQANPTAQQGPGSQGPTPDARWRHTAVPAPTSNLLQHPSFHFTNEETKRKREEVTKFMWQSRDRLGRSPEHAAPWASSWRGEPPVGAVPGVPVSAGGRPHRLVP